MLNLPVEEFIYLLCIWFVEPHDFVKTPPEGGAYMGRTTGARDAQLHRT